MIRIRHQEKSLTQIFLEFFRLGLISFGGPAAHMALMEQELVSRKKWVNRQQFLDFMGGVNLIPGPSATQMTLLIGYRLRGFWGMIVGGLGFIIPAAIITGVLAFFYTRYQALPQLDSILGGIKPAIMAVIAGAILKLGKAAVKSYPLALLGLLVIAASFAGINELTAIISAGVAGMIIMRAKDKAACGNVGTLFPLLAAQTAISTVAGYSSIQLFWVFFKIGSLLFGTGYVLVAYVNTELVEGLGWITSEQLLDAIAIGQFTPGPVLSSATFIGYLLDGPKGALIATAGIFLPSWFFILVLYPFIDRLRKSPLTAAFLDSVNVAAVAIMVVVMLTFSAQVLIAWQPIMIFALALIAVFGPWKINPLWIVLGAALTGYLLF